MGAALGAIIATIIENHMVARSSAGPIVWVDGAAIPPDAADIAPIPAIAGWLSAAAVGGRPSEVIRHAATPMPAPEIR